MKNDLIEKLITWYSIHCNGEWEHTYGITIDTLDNLGWHIKIDLQETPLENIEFNYEKSNSESDWIIIRSKGYEFNGSGDPRKLGTILNIFFEELVYKIEKNKYKYEIYIPYKNENKLCWRLGIANLIKDDIFIIDEISTDSMNNIYYEDSKFSQDTEIDKFLVNDFVVCKNYQSEKFTFLGIKEKYIE